MTRMFMKTLVVFLVTFTVLGGPIFTGAADWAPDKFGTPADEEGKEKVEFNVELWGIPLLSSYMEAKRIYPPNDDPMILLVHQPFENWLWNDLMISCVDQTTLLPQQLDIVVKKKNADRKESVFFDHIKRQARFEVLDNRSGTLTTSEIKISHDAMDPLSAFYYMRMKISEENPLLQINGVTGKRRFTFSAWLAGSETVTVPAGTFEALRVECKMIYWPLEQENKIDQDQYKRKGNNFTVWVSKNGDHTPLQIGYKLLLGRVWVKAARITTTGTLMAGGVS